MKLLFSLILTFSFSLLASTTCPNIAGTYTCTYKYETLHQTIEETPTGFFITANGVEMEYFIDGSPVLIPETDSVRDGKVISSCGNGLFVVNFTAMIMYQGAEVGKEVQRTSYEIKDGNLVMTRKTKVKGIPLPTKKYICVK